MLNLELLEQTAEEGRQVLKEVVMLEWFYDIKTEVSVERREHSVCKLQSYQSVPVRGYSKGRGDVLSPRSVCSELRSSLLSVNKMSFLQSLCLLVI